MTKFGTNTSGAVWWPNLQLMQVALSGGRIWKLLLAERFTQVVDFNPWVRCASGNVFTMFIVLSGVRIPHNQIKSHLMIFDENILLFTIFFTFFTKTF